MEQQENKNELQLMFNNSLERRQRLEAIYVQFPDPSLWTEEQKSMFWEYTEACQECRYLAEKLDLQNQKVRYEKKAKLKEEVTSDIETSPQNDAKELEK